MLTVRCYTPGAVREGIDPADLSELRLDAGNVLWVDVEDATDADLDLLAEEFALHPLAVEDARKHGQRPKVEHYATHSFLVAYSAHLGEVDLWVGPTWVITVRGHNRMGAEWDAAPARGLFERTSLHAPSVGLLVWAVLDTLVDEYFDAIDTAEDHLEALEDRVFTEEGGDERAVQRELFDIRRRLLEFRRSVVPLREVLAALLRHEVAAVQGEAIVLLQDVYDHVLRAIDLIDSQRELMGNAVDAHLAIISNRINQVMKAMTSWGAILVTAGLIAGIYGMNFEHMPELRWAFGYPFAIGLMLVSTAVLWRWFRKRDWI